MPVMLVNHVELSGIRRLVQHCAAWASIPSGSYEKGSRVTIVAMMIRHTNACLLYLEVFDKEAMR
jgi:hypothetical protein